MRKIIAKTKDYVIWEDEKGIHLLNKDTHAVAKRGKNG